MKGKSRTTKRKVDKDVTMSMLFSESRQQQLPFATVESPRPNKEMTSNDKSTSCEKNILKQKSSKILEVGLTSNEKDYYPFWNERCAEIASNLWLPTETDWRGSDSTLLDTLSKEMVENSWFSTRLHTLQKKNLPKTCSISFTSSHVECTDLEITKSRYIRLYLTKEQRKTFRYWQDVSRYVFNWTIDFIRSCVNWTPNWMEIKKHATQLLPKWTKDCPFQIKAIAIRDAVKAFFAAKGKPKYRSRKNPVQSGFIPKSAIKEMGIYPRVSGKGLRYSESLPESFLDSRLVWKAGKYYLSVPFKTSRVPYGENQARVVAIDPGIRSFAAFYSDDTVGLIGQGDFSRIQRMAHHLDKLISKMSKAPKQKKRKMRMATARMREKVKNLIDELHHKSALFLVSNFDLILLPTFETSRMASKAGRKINNKSVRSLLTFAHYRFKQFIKHKAFEHGKRVVDVNEAYTSKTHPETGQINNIGGAKYIKLLSGDRVNRDLVGARNIMLRALVDTPQSSDWQLTVINDC